MIGLPLVPLWGLVTGEIEPYRTVHPADAWSAIESPPTGTSQIPYGTVLYHSSIACTVALLFARFVPSSPTTVLLPPNPNPGS